MPPLTSSAPGGRSGRPAEPGWRRDLWEIIFETESPAGKQFDVALLALIALSVLTVMLESVDGLRRSFGPQLRILEWLVTGLFTLEYAVRLWVSEQPARYARSFFGVVDLLSILPTWASLLMPGTHPLLIIRGLRLLRVFRVLKLAQFLSEANVLLTAIRTGRTKVIVFLGTVSLLAIILGTAMYLIEGAEHGFTSIPRSIYWAIVTMTTVGYGDITPQTVPGQLLSVIVMLLGYGIIAVPTGIVTAEIIEATRPSLEASARVCGGCGIPERRPSARFCCQCGSPLPAGVG